jgi:hypothetical protein
VPVGRSCCICRCLNVTRPPVYLVRRGCLLAYWLAYTLHQVPQIERVDLIFDIVDCDDITRMQCRDMLGLLTIADTTNCIHLSCTWACEWPLHMKHVIHADGWWQWASSAGLPAQTTRWCLCMARGIRDPAMDAATSIVCPRVPPRGEPKIRHLAAHHQPSLRSVSLASTEDVCLPAR